MKINVTIEAILFGVTESVIGNLDFGNDYTIKKDTLMNMDLVQRYDYTAFGIRRIYGHAVIDDKLGVAVLRKDAVLENIDSKLLKDDHFMNDDDAISICGEFEDKEIDYIDKQMRAIRFYNENGFNIQEVLFKFEIESQNNNIEESITSKRPFPDRIYNKVSKLELEDYSNLNMFLKSFKQSTLNTAFDSNLLNSVLFLYDQSYYAPVETLRFMVCVIGLESIFAKGNSELTYKLSRSVGMLLSKSKDEYKTIRDKVKDIYNKRSTYVHTGLCKNIKEQDIVDARDILRNVIKCIISMNMKKDDLLEYLEVKGFEV